MRGEGYTVHPTIPSVRCHRMLIVVGRKFRPKVHIRIRLLLLRIRQYKPSSELSAEVFFRSSFKSTGSTGYCFRFIFIAVITYTHSTSVDWRRVGCYTHVSIRKHRPECDWLRRPPASIYTQRHTYTLLAAFLIRFRAAAVLFSCRRMKTLIRQKYAVKLTSTTPTL